MATDNQIKQFEKRLREYRKKYLTKKENLKSNESATRIMVNYFLTDVLGYTELDEIKTEYLIKGEYADYVIQMNRKKHFVIEVKAAAIDLNAHHLRQSFSYAANEGIDWIVLFNGREIKVYKVIFAKPVTHNEVISLDLTDLSAMKAAASQLVHLTKSSILKDELNQYWKRFDALTPESLSKIIYTEDVIKSIRLKIKKSHNINFSQEDIHEAMHKLINNEHKDIIKPKKLK